MCVGDAVGEWIKDDDVSHGECIGDDLVGGRFEGFDFPGEQMWNAVDVTTNECLDHVGAIGKAAFVDFGDVIFAGVEAIGFGDSAYPAGFFCGGSGLNEASGDDERLCASCGLCGCGCG